MTQEVKTMNANEIKITESTEIKTMTVADLLTAQDVGDIATFAQRACLVRLRKRAWSAKIF